MKATLCIMSALLWASAVAAVEIQVQGPAADQRQVVTLAEGSRLDAALGQLTDSGAIYWPASRITNAEQDRKIQAEQQALIQRLTRLMLTAEQLHEPTLAYNSRLMLQLVSGLVVAGRLEAKLDPDWVRIRAEANPPLAGHYRLLLAAREPRVHLYGLMASPASVSLIPGQEVAAYLQGREFFAGAEQTQVMLCQPDGRVQPVPIGYWNKLHREPMPGAALLVGFADGTLPAEYSDLNLRIAKLIAARTTL